MLYFLSFYTLLFVLPFGRQETTTTYLRFYISMIGTLLFLSCVHQQGYFRQNTRNHPLTNLLQI